MATASHTATVNVPPEVLFGVITDYEKYPKFLPETVDVEIASRGKRKKDGTRTVDVDFQIKVVKRFEYTLCMIESPSDSVSWEQVTGPFKRNTGSWTLEAKGKNKTEATYAVTVEVGFLVPRSIINMLVGKSLPDTVRRFKERAESLAEKSKKRDKKKDKKKKKS